MKCPECDMPLLRGEECPFCDDKELNSENHSGIGPMTRIPTVEDMLYASTYRQIGGAGDSLDELLWNS